MIEEIDKSSALALHYQLKELIKDKIESGKYKIGDKIPTEDNLCSRYNLSRTTVRNALKELESKGLIRRERSKGTFVSIPDIIQGPEELKSFSEDMKSRGLKPRSIELERKIIYSKGIISEKLQVNDGEKIIYIKRLRLADDKPMGVQEVFLPYDKFRDMLYEEKIESIYELLRKKYNIAIKHAQETYRAIMLNEIEAKLLKVNKNSPAFYAERLSFGADKKPIEFVNSIMRADRYEVTINLYRDYRKDGSNI